MNDHDHGSQRRGSPRVRIFVVAGLIAGLLGAYVGITALGDSDEPGGTTSTLSVLTTVDSTGDTGYYPSITIGADGNPIISYHDSSAGDLRVAKCIDPACTGSATLTTVDSAGSTGVDASIAIGVDGNPIMTYYYASAGDLRVAECIDPACIGTATVTTVDSTGDTGYNPSIAIGVDGNPIISYFDKTAQDLSVAKCGTWCKSVVNSS